MDGAINMTDHSSTGTQPNSRTLLADEFANRESDRYRGLLEARAASLKKDIAETQEASGGIPDYKRLTRLQDSLRIVSEKLRRTIEADSVFRKALIFETVEEAAEKMTDKERQAYFEHLAKLRDRRISKDPSDKESFIGFIKKLFF